MSNDHPMRDVVESPDPLKSGWLSSEFYVALIPQALGLLIVLGVILPSDKDTLEKSLTAIVGAVGTIAASALVVWKYIAGRAQLKEAQINANAAVKQTETQAKATVEAASTTAAGQVEAARETARIEAKTP